MNSKYKIKIICGFRQDQEYTIDANEAHKAYYLFNHPEARGTFDNGLALKGSDIQRIVPDYHATLGLNPSHKLTGDDWNEIHASGVMGKLEMITRVATEVGKVATPEDLQTPLLTLHRGKYDGIAAPREQKKLGTSRSVGEVMATNEVPRKSKV